LLVGHESSEPEICGCCARPAIPSGVIDAPGALVALWNCTFCNTNLSLKVQAMKANELHAIEKKAIMAALKAAPVDLVGTILRGLIDQGVNDLSKINADNYTALRESLVKNHVVINAAGSLLLTYTQQVRRELVNMKAGA
jgi:hypothetical protein